MALHLSSAMEERWNSFIEIAREIYYVGMVPDKINSHGGELMGVPNTMT